ncbi:MAG: hypothetical protein ACFFAQ_04080 [Promethearchaeota archaeon]
MSSNIEDIYQTLLNAGITEDEIERQVNERYNEFQGFMSKQAVLFLIAKENGLDITSSSSGKINHYEIDYNDFASPISKITETMSNVVITGRILKIFGTRNFVRKDGSPGTIGSFIIGDESGTVKIVLWDDQAEIMENDYFQAGEIVQVIGGYSKVGLDDEIEVHLSKAGKIILSPKDVNLSQIPKLDSFKDLKLQGSVSLKEDPRLSIKDLYCKEGFIKSITGIIQIEEFKEIMKKNEDKTFLLKLILSDDTSSIRVLVWGINAVESLKILNDGIGVKLSNVMIKENPYNNEKELVYTKNSRMKIL